MKPTKKIQVFILNLEMDIINHLRNTTDALVTMIKYMLYEYNIVDILPYLKKIVEPGKKIPLDAHLNVHESISAIPFDLPKALKNFPAVHASGKAIILVRSLRGADPIYYILAVDKNLSKTNMGLDITKWWNRFMKQELPIGYWYVKNYDRSLLFYTVITGVPPNVPILKVTSIDEYVRNRIHVVACMHQTYIEYSGDPIDEMKFSSDTLRKDYQSIRNQSDSEYFYYNMWINEGKLLSRIFYNIPECINKVVPLLATGMPIDNIITKILSNDIMRNKSYFEIISGKKQEFETFDMSLNNRTQFPVDMKEYKKLLSQIAILDGVSHIPNHDIIGKYSEMNH